MAGNSAPLVDMLGEVQVGSLLLKMCTPRGSEMELLTALPANTRIGVGVVNQKVLRTETLEAVKKRIEEAIGLFGRERMLLHPDCGFATFADHLICCTRR